MISFITIIFRIHQISNINKKNKGTAQKGLEWELILFPTLS